MSVVVVTVTDHAYVCQEVGGFPPGEGRPDSGRQLGDHAQQGRGQTHLAACPTARHPRAVRRRRRRRPGRGGAPGLRTDRHDQRDRALPPPHSLHPHPGVPAQHLHQAQTIDKSVFEYWTHALSYVPTRDVRSSCPTMKRNRQAPRMPWYRTVTDADLRKVLTLIRGTAPSPSATSRTTCWSRRPCLGEPQAVEAGPADAFSRAS